MRMPRFRIRMMMVLIAIAALLLTGLARRSMFQGIAEYHRVHAGVEASASEIVSIVMLEHADGAIEFDSWPRHRWHKDLQKKYERAARYPWLPVEPDPPEPK